MIRLLVVISVVLSGCATWNSGLSPIYPKYNKTIDTLYPTFAWQAAEIEGAQHLVYELVVFYHDDSIAYQAARIPRNFHTVRVPLLPGQLYRWTVRPVYYKDGQWFGEPWNRRKKFWYGGVVMGWGSALYCFRTPDIYKPKADHAFSGEVISPELLRHRARERYKKEYGSQCQSTPSNATNDKERAFSGLRFTIAYSSKDESSTGKTDAFGVISDLAKQQIDSVLQQHIGLLQQCFVKTDQRSIVTFELLSNQQVQAMKPSADSSVERDRCLQEVLINAFESIDVNEVGFLLIAYSDNRNEQIVESIPKARVLSVIRSRVSEVQHCYKEALQGWPELKGRVSVHFIVAPDGNVHEARIAKSELGRVELECCIRNAIKRWSFPPPKGGGIVLIKHRFILGLNKNK